MKYFINRLKPVFLTGFFLVIYHSSGTAQAIEVIDPGRALAAQCSQCHGMEGNNFEGFDSLMDESFDKIYDELREMFDNPVSKNELMDHQAKGYIPKDAEGNIDDAALVALAEYFSGQAETNSDSPVESSSVSKDSEDAKDEDVGDEEDEKDEEEEEEEEEEDDDDD